MSVWNARRVLQAVLVVLQGGLGLSPRKRLHLGRGFLLFEGETGCFFKFALIYAPSRLLERRGDLRRLLCASLGRELEREVDRARPRPELPHEEGLDDGALDCLGENARVAPDDLLPHLHLRSARERAGVGLCERRERAARREKDDQLLLVSDEVRERIDAARSSGEVCDVAAVRPHAHLSVLERLCRDEVVVALRVRRVRRHGDGGLGNGVALEEPSPVAFAHRVADVDRESGIVDRAVALYADEPRVSARNRRAGEAVALRVVVEDSVVHQELPRVVEPHFVDGSVFLPDRLREREAPEESRVEVLKHLGEVLDVGEEAFHRVLLLVGELAFHRRQRRDLELESGDRALAAVDAGEEYRVRRLDLLEEPVQPLRVARSRRVEDSLRCPYRDADERVRALQPAVRRVDRDRPLGDARRRGVVEFFRRCLLSRHIRSLCRCCAVR